MAETSITLKPGETIDQLGYHGIRIIQNPAKFKFTIDAFLLVGFVHPKPFHNIVDLGTGGGVLPLLLTGQDRVNRITGIEIQPELADMARRSVALNGFNQQISIVEADLRKIHQRLPMNSFDLVMANPPYYPVAKSVIPENRALATAKFELHCTLHDWVQAAARLVKGNGRVSVIYPTERLTELFAVYAQFHLTPKRLCMIHPDLQSCSNLVLVEARPGAKPGLQVLPPLSIYSQPGQYTEIMNQIFHGKKI